MSKKMSEKIAKIVERVLVKTGESTIPPTCRGIYHQPQVPEKLLRRKNN